MTQNIIDLRRILESFIKIGFNDENYKSLFSGVFTINDVIADMMYLEFQLAIHLPLTDPQYKRLLVNNSNWLSLQTLEKFNEVFNLIVLNAENYKEIILSECRKKTYNNSTLEKAITKFYEDKMSMLQSINTDKASEFTAEILYWLSETTCNIEFIYNIVMKSIENGNPKLYDSYFRMNTFCNLRNITHSDINIKVDYQFELFFTKNRYINLIANEKYGSSKYRIEEDRWFCLQDMFAKILPRAALDNYTLTEWIIINTTLYDWLSFFKEYSTLNCLNSIKLQFSEEILDRFYAAYCCIDDWDYNSNDS